MASPTTVTKVQSFLGFTGYYHQFIPKFTQIAQPLHALTSDKNASKKREAILWDDRCQQSIDELKCLCTAVSILAYADFIRPFKLHTDVCWSSLGAVLYQTSGDGTDYMISYASRN